jgi:hypothetical protein
MDKCWNLIPLRRYVSLSVIEPLVICLCVSLCVQDELEKRFEELLLDDADPYDSDSARAELIARYPPKATASSSRPSASYNSCNSRSTTPTTPTNNTINGASPDVARIKTALDRVATALTSVVGVLTTMSTDTNRIANVLCGGGEAKGAATVAASIKLLQQGSVSLFDSGDEEEDSVEEEEVKAAKAVSLAATKKKASTKKKEKTLGVKRTNCKR